MELMCPALPWPGASVASGFYVTSQDSLGQGLEVTRLALNSTRVLGILFTRGGHW